MARVFVYDTTLRDGSQGEGVNFSLQDKLLITRKLDELGVDFIEGGYPLSNPKDFEYFREVRKLSLRHARVAAFGMTRRKNARPEDDTCLKALLDAGAPVVTIVGKTWDLHVREVLGTTLDENLRMIADSVAFCKAAGREVFYDAEHFFDGYKHNPEYALQTLRAAQDAGAGVVILCDTNGGTLPEEIAERVEKVKRALRALVGIHCHNDCDVAVANTLAAVGNRRRILVSELAGQASILAKLQKYAAAGDRELAVKVLNRVQDLEHEGYEFEAADASFDLLVMKLAGKYQPKFERLAYRVN